MGHGQLKERNEGGYKSITKARAATSNSAESEGECIEKVYDYVGPY